MDLNNKPDDINELDISVRAANELHKNKIHKISELIEYSIEGLANTGISPKTLTESRIIEGKPYIIWTIWFYRLKTIW